MSLTLKGLTLTSEFSIQQSTSNLTHNDVDTMYGSDGFGANMAATPDLSKIVIGHRRPKSLQWYNLIQIFSASLDRFASTGIKSTCQYQTGVNGSFSPTVLTATSSPSIISFNIQDYDPGFTYNQVLEFTIDKNVMAFSTYIKSVKIVSKMANTYDQVIFNEAVTSGMMSLSGANTIFTIPSNTVWEPLSYVNGEWSTGNVIPVEITITYGELYYTNYPSVKVYTFSNNQISKTPSIINTPANENNSSFGKSVDINDAGTRVFVGCPFSNGVSNAVSQSGRAFVYDWNGTNWVLYNTYLSATTPQTFAQYGFKVRCSSDGLLLAVGEFNRAPSGLVHIYRDNGSAFVKVATITSPLNVGLGQDFSMNGDGSRIAIQSPLDPDGSSIRMYEETSPDVWTITDTIRPTVGLEDNDGVYNFNMSEDGEYLVLGNKNLSLYTRQLGGLWTGETLESPSEPTFSKIPTRFKFSTITSNNNTIITSSEHEYPVWKKYLKFDGTMDDVNNTYSMSIIAQSLTSVTGRDLASGETRTNGFLNTSSNADGTFTGTSGTVTNPLTGTLHNPGQTKAPGTYSSYTVDIFNNIKTDSQNNLDNVATIDIKFNSANLPINLLEKVEIKGIFGRRNGPASTPKLDSSTYIAVPNNTIVMVTPFCTDGSVNFNGNVSFISNTFEHKYYQPTVSFPRGGTVYRWKLDTAIGTSSDNLENLFIPGNTYSIKFYFSKVKQGKVFVYEKEDGVWKIKYEDKANQYSGIENSYGRSLVCNTTGKTFVSSDSLNSRCYLVSKEIISPMASVTRMIGDGAEQRTFSTSAKNDLLLSWSGKFATDALTYSKVNEDVYGSPSYSGSRKLYFGPRAITTNSLSNDITLNNYKLVNPLPDSVSANGIPGGYGGNGLLSEQVLVSITNDTAYGSHFLEYTGSLNTLGYNFKCTNYVELVPREDGRIVWYLDNQNTTPITTNTSFDDNTIGSYKIRKLAIGPYTTYSYSECIVLEVYGNLSAVSSLPISLRYTNSANSPLYNTTSSTVRTSSNPLQKIVRSDAYGTYTELVYDSSTFTNYTSGSLAFTNNLSSSTSINPGTVQIDFFGTKTNSITSENKNHNLGAVPSFYMIRPTQNNNSWFIWHKDMAANTYSTDLFVPPTVLFNGTVSAPTSTYITTQSNELENSKDLLYSAYIFKNTSYVHAGSYTGTGASFVLSTIDNPTFIMIKRGTNASSYWTCLYIEDMDKTKVYRYLFAGNQSAYISGLNVFTDNSITIGETDAHINTNGSVYHYIVFSGKKITV